MDSPAPAPFYFDCDTGIDDSLALALLLAQPGIDLKGIGTVSGNIDAAAGARNTLALLELAGRTDIPVAVGATDPLAGEYDGYVPHIHGRNGIGDVEIPDASVSVADGSAAEMLVALAHEFPGELEVVAVGPLTNLALALQLEPALPRLVKNVTVMGGALWVPGNVTPVAEANVYNDADAAAIVVKAGWPLTLVPLDVTMQHHFDEGHQAAFAEVGTGFHSALAGMLTTYLDFYETVFAERRSSLHDPLAVAIATGDVVPDIVRSVGVDVGTSGDERGHTVPVEGGSPAVRVVTHAPADTATILSAGILSLATPDRA
ncbi:nucleoside hydrolase [Frondihabitans australicus]|uniref:Purine nucleosidase n=1 Tax=Frondihabitans australicus TaxID=386892 RepID=A0A495IKP0_9MICO|nr:nucleoside hydrolase [Frondihabitans australicus]RKR76534.1 purine nucleosidase [Frondihabitans australicus]